MQIIKKLRKKKLLKKIKNDPAINGSAETYYRDDFYYDIREGDRKNRIQIGTGCLLGGG